MQSINGYLGDIDNAWNDYNGEILAKLLSFRDVHVFNPRLQLENPEPSVEKVLGPQIDEVRSKTNSSETCTLVSYRLIEI